MQFIYISRERELAFPLKSSLNLAIDTSSIANTTSIVWILYKPLNYFHSGKSFCLYSTAARVALEIYVKSCYCFAQNPPKSSHFFQSKIHRLCHSLQDTPWFSTLLPLWSYFMADFPSLSLGHMLLPRGLCTSAAGSSAWHLHVLLP